MSLFKHLTILLSLSLLGQTLLVACGGSGGEDEGTNDQTSTSASELEEGSIVKGRFIDSAVEGLDYTAGDESGTTDEDGTFHCVVGSPIEFRIGDIILGQSSDCAEFLTPIDLVEGATDVTNPTVTNMARFLQTLDADANPENGITIPEQTRSGATGLALNFNQSVEDFENDSNLLDLLQNLADGRALRPIQEAQDHLAGSVLGLLSGEWEGTYSGPYNGTWKVTIVQTGLVGTISGQGLDNQTGEFGISGQVASSGEAEFGGGSGTAGSSNFVGTFRYNSSASGTWIIVETGEGGTWTGRHTKPTGENPSNPDENPDDPNPEDDPEELLELTVSRDSPNNCFFQTLDNAIACSLCDNALFSLPFTVTADHGSQFRFSVAPSTTYDSVDNGAAQQNLKAFLYDSNDAEVEDLEITCPTDGTVCEVNGAKNVALAPGNYKLVTEAYSCDGTGGTQNASIATQATVTNVPFIP